MRLVLIICLLPFLGFAQQGKTVSDATTARTEYYLNLFNKVGTNTNVTTETFSAFVAKLEEKQGSFKSDKDFLRFVFVKTHQRYLKHFRDYATFSELSTNGNYNCLTGTALYALILDHFGFSYSIIETNYHIFLNASTSKGNVLMEATDPMNGFVENETDIAARIDLYKQNVLAKKSSGKSYYQYEFNLYKEVSLDEMLGLMHYNIAIVAYNEQDLELAVSHLSLAAEFYPSQRTEDFAGLVLLTLMENITMEMHAREICIKKVQSLRELHSSNMASAKLN